MTGTNRTTQSPFTLALEATGNLWAEAFANLERSGLFTASIAHSDIEHTPLLHKTGPFYEHLLPFRTSLVVLLADTYRRYFKLALANPRETGREPRQWTWTQIQPAVGRALESLFDWYMLACDRANQLNLESWRAPAWLFAVSQALVGIGPLKTKHVPPHDSEEKLGAAHTRVLLNGARRVFLRELGAAIQTVWNEETAAAGATPAPTVNGKRRGPNKRRGWQQKQKLYGAIQKALSRDSSLQGIDLCAALDKRHAPPLLDWKTCGEWRDGLTFKEAWRVPALRRKIRRVRQEAMKTR